MAQRTRPDVISPDAMYDICNEDSLNLPHLARKSTRNATPAKRSANKRSRNVAQEKLRRIARRMREKQRDLRD